MYFTQIILLFLIMFLESMVHKFFDFFFFPRRGGAARGQGQVQIPSSLQVFSYKSVLTWHGDYELVNDPLVTPFLQLEVLGLELGRCIPEHFDLYKYTVWAFHPILSLTLSHKKKFLKYAQLLHWVSLCMYGLIPCSITLCYQKTCHFIWFSFWTISMKN